MVFFKDFGKTVTDLFKADKYKLDRTLQVTARADATEWVTKTVVRDGKVKNKLTYKQSDKTFGAVEVEVPTGGTPEIKYTTPSLCEGLKSDLILKNPTVDLKGKYTRGSIQSEVKATLNTNKAALKSVYLDASVGVEGFSVGGALKVQPGAEKPLADYNVGLQYTPSDSSTLALTTENQCDQISTSFWYRFSPKGEICARYNLDLDKPGNPQVELGGKYKVDEKGTVQGVVQSDGAAMFLYKHNVSDSVTASLGAAFDSKTFSAESTSIHYKLEFAA